MGFVWKFACSLVLGTQIHHVGWFIFALRHKQQG